MLSPERGVSPRRWRGEHPIDRARPEDFPALRAFSDGDALFALGTGESCTTLGMMTLCVMAADVCTLAVVRAIRTAQGVTVGAAHMPAAGDLG